MKKKLNELQAADYQKLLDNEKVVDKVQQNMFEDTEEYISDILAYIEDDLSSYNIGGSSNYNNCLDVKLPYDFLIDLDDMNQDIYILTDKERLAFKNDFINFTEQQQQAVTDEQQDALDEKAEELANKWAKILLNNLVKEYDACYVNDNILDEMSEILADLYPDDAYYETKDNKIYYVTCD